MLDKLLSKIKEMYKSGFFIRRVICSAEADKLLKDLFNHVGDPNKRIWPQCTVGKIINGKQVWFTGGVDDEFRDYLVRIKKYLNRHCV